MTSRSEGEEKFTIACFTKQGSARLSKTYRKMGYVPVREWVDDDTTFHCVEYKKEK